MRILLTLLTLILISSTALAETNPPRVERVLSQEEQAALTPEQVLTVLKQGNTRFVSGTITSRDHSALVRSAAEGQFPKAVILSCLDSRIPVEDVFDRGIGDIFVARVAGNFENTDILGSMEFATLISGAKVVLVMGHSDCGAIKAAIDGAELGVIGAQYIKIQEVTGFLLRPAFGVVTTVIAMNLTSWSAASAEPVLRLARFRPSAVSSSTVFATTRARRPFR